MMLDKPKLYFRRKDNGAGVYRVDAQNSNRMDLQHIAVVKQNGDIKVQNKQELSQDEVAEINAWFTARETTQSARDSARLDMLVGEMNRAAQWLQSDASGDEIMQVAQPLLMAMHDLRTTLVKQMARNSPGID
ncbi:MAG: hypothetical protein V3V13_12260 [Paracoccaceae bacterium]